MKLENFDDEKYYRNERNTKKTKKSRAKAKITNRMPKTKPKDGDYHIIARRMREQKRTNWYSKPDFSSA